MHYFYESAKLVIFADSYYVAIDNFCYYLLFIELILHIPDVV